MTAIVGVIDDKYVWIGGDSASANDSTLCTAAQPKVFENNSGMIIGYTSSWRMGQLLQYKLDMGKLPHINVENVIEFMITDFVDSVRECFKGSGFSKVVDNEETGGDFIVGFRGSLFTIFEDFSVLSYSDGYTAVGSGVEFALGSLYTTRDGEGAKKRVELALGAASYHNPYVQGPFHILKQQRNK